MKRFFPMLIMSVFISGCGHITNETESKSETDLALLENEIELRLREYEAHLKNGDSIALGNMYMEDAEIIPSTVGRENIIKVFGSMIRDSIIGSFQSTQLWGNEELLVEDGTGTWSHINGTVLSRGRYLLVWQKENGEWKILRDTWFPE